MAKTYQPNDVCEHVEMAQVAAINGSTSSPEGVGKELQVDLGERTTAKAWFSIFVSLFIEYLASVGGL